MSRISRGKIVTFINSEGNKQIAIAYDSEQAAEFSKVKKVFVRYLDSNLLPMKDDQGKNIVGLKDLKLLTIIGFID